MAIAGVSRAAIGTAREDLDVVSGARWLPTVGSYLLREFGRSLGLCLSGFIGLYLCVDFFERFRGFLDHGASTGLILLYFALKTPRIITEMMPVAVLAAVLLSVGALARRNEIMAMRACGISLWQIAGPVIGACLGLSLLTLMWNEYVVPECSMRAHYVERVSIKKKPFKGHFGEWEIWYHGKQSFTNIARFDANRSQIHGLKRYEFDDQFRLIRMITATTATWEDGRWRTTEATEVNIAPGGAMTTRSLPESEIALSETPEDFSAVHREPEDLSFGALREEIADLRSKGIDTTDATVGLWLKLAVPFVSLVMALLALPLATRRNRNRAVAANVGLALVVGFSYWVVLALAMSLGRTGILPAPVAAWSANVIFGTIGVIFFLGSE
jgi:lipopolysaccharide export system permease protein